MGRVRSPGSIVTAFGFYSKYIGNMGKRLMLRKEQVFILFFPVFLVIRKVPGVMVLNTCLLNQ